MIDIKKISFSTKWLSNHYYLSEVPVEGRKSRKSYFTFWANGNLIQQIIRAGNCCTLLSTPMDMTEDNFWRPSHFDDFVRYVFWTFKDVFLVQILERMKTLRPETLLGYSNLLEGNLIPFEGELPEDADHELTLCWLKNVSLKKDEAFARMYSLDQHNRRIVLDALKGSATAETASIGKNRPKEPGFLDLLTPMDGSPEKTLQFIIARIGEAGFKFRLFSPVQRLSVDKNPYGFNGCLAAMIDFFYQHGYFKNEFLLDQVFVAYFAFSGNSVGKFKVFLSEFRQDRSYKKHMDKLKALKIKALH